MNAAALADRRTAVLAALDTIHDPCSVSIGKPIGLVGMGIIAHVGIDGGEVHVEVLPTFPDCLFRGVFEERIETTLVTLPWCRKVTVGFRPADESWDETRMSPEARRRLGRRATIAGETAA